MWPQQVSLNLSYDLCFVMSSQQNRPFSRISKTHGCATSNRRRSETSASTSVAARRHWRVNVCSLYACGGMKDFTVPPLPAAPHPFLLLLRVTGWALVTLRNIAGTVRAACLQASLNWICKTKTFTLSDRHLESRPNVSPSLFNLRGCYLHPSGGVLSERWIFNLSAKFRYRRNFKASLAGVFLTFHRLFVSVSAD